MFCFDVRKWTDTGCFVGNEEAGKEIFLHCTENIQVIFKRSFKGLARNKHAPSTEGQNLSVFNSQNCNWS